MIQGFGDKATERFFWEGKCPAAWRAFEKAAVRKLSVLHAATALSELRSPAGNRLEKLSGDRNGAWSIRINDQWRICFTWTAQGPDHVIITDYH